MDRQLFGQAGNVPVYSLFFKTNLYRHKFPLLYATGKRSRLKEEMENNRHAAVLRLF